MIISDFVQCEHCGAEIEHLIVNGSVPWRNDPDYKVCDACAEQRDIHARHIAEDEDGF